MAQASKRATCSTSRTASAKQSFSKTQSMTQKPDNIKTKIRNPYAKKHPSPSPKLLSPFQKASKMHSTINIMIDKTNSPTLPNIEDLIADQTFSSPNGSIDKGIDNLLYSQIKRNNKEDYDKETNSKENSYVETSNLYLNTKDKKEKEKNYTSNSSDNYPDAPLLDSLLQNASHTQLLMVQKFSWKITVSTK